MVSPSQALLIKVRWLNNLNNFARTAITYGGLKLDKMEELEATDGAFMVDKNSISFDLTDCEIHSEDRERTLWFDSKGVAHLLRFNQGPMDWPFDLTDLQAARGFYGNQCAEAKGVMLSMDGLSVDGIEVLQGLFKYRSPQPQSLAMMFVGILWLPFSNFRYQINIEALEGGTTGIREATVSVMDPKDYPNPKILEETPWPRPEDKEPVMVKSAEEMFTRMSQTTLKKLPSDDVQFDSKFPMHPLSLVRARMSKVAETLKMNKMWWQQLKPYRISH